MTDAELNALSALVHAHCVAIVTSSQEREHQGRPCAGPGYTDDGEAQAIYDELVRRGILRPKGKSDGGVQITNHC